MSLNYTRLSTYCLEAKLKWGIETKLANLVSLNNFFVKNIDLKQNCKGSLKLNIIKVIENKFCKTKQNFE